MRSSFGRATFRPEDRKRGRGPRRHRQSAPLKLKTADFKIRTRAQSLESPTQLAGRIFAAARVLLERETDRTQFRLLGVGVSALATAAEADPADLVDGRAALAETCGR